MIYSGIEVGALCRPVNNVHFGLLKVPGAAYVLVHCCVERQYDNPEPGLTMTA